MGWRWGRRTFPTSHTQLIIYSFAGWNDNSYGPLCLPKVNHTHAKMEELPTLNGFIRDQPLRGIQIQIIIQHKSH